MQMFHAGACPMVNLENVGVSNHGANVNICLPLVICRDLGGCESPWDGVEHSLGSTWSNHSPTGNCGNNWRKNWRFARPCIHFRLWNEFESGSLANIGDRRNDGKTLAVLWLIGKPVICNNYPRSLVQTVNIITGIEPFFGQISNISGAIGLILGLNSQFVSVAPSITNFIQRGIGYIGRFLGSASSISHLLKLALHHFPLLLGIMDIEDGQNNDCHSSQSAIIMLPSCVSKNLHPLCQPYAQIFRAATKNRTTSFRYLLDFWE
jgi:hypothetical protein